MARSRQLTQEQNRPNVFIITIAKTFFHQWVPRFGVPVFLVTNRGRQLESELFQNISEIFGFNRLRTTSYHPQTKSMIQRMQRTLKTAFKAREGDWIQEQPIILLSLHAIPNAYGFSIFTTVTCTSMFLPAVQKGKSTDVGYIKDRALMMKTVNFATLVIRISHLFLSNFDLLHTFD